MAKYEADHQMLNRLNTSIKRAKDNPINVQGGVVSTPLVRLIEGEHYYDMGIIYAMLLADHIETQLKAGNVVDVELFSHKEWLEMEAQLQDELNNDN